MFFVFGEKMITQFPKIYPGELLFSALARYHVRTGYLTQNESISLLLGEKYRERQPYLECPERLEYMHQSTQHFGVGRIVDWIKNHTLYGYYTSFTNHSTQKRVLDLMLKGGESHTAFYHTGSRGSQIRTPPFFRYCKSCVEEDYYLYGESYWRSIHQVPSVLLCIKHKEVLRDSTVIYHHTRANPYQIASKEVCQGEPIVSDVSSKEKEILLYLARETEKLFTCEYDFECAELKQKYLYLTDQRGFMTVGKMIRQTQLRDALYAFYGKRLLGLLQCDLNTKGWMRNYPLYAEHEVHPMRHLVLLTFLGIRIEDLNLVDPQIEKPFINGPCPCLNRLAAHYKQRVISDVVVKRDKKTGLPLGIFSCSCGMVYTRRGPDRDADDHYNVTSFRKRGKVWFDAIQSYHQKGYSIREIILRSKKTMANVWAESYFSRI